MAPLMARAAGVAGRIGANAVRVVRRGVGHFALPRGRIWIRIRLAPPIEDLLPPLLLPRSRSLALLPGAAPGVGARRFGPASRGRADSPGRGATRVRSGPHPAPRHRAGARCGQAGGDLRRDAEQRGHAAGQRRQPALAARERLRLPARAALRELFREGSARQPGRGARGGAGGWVQERRRDLHPGGDVARAPGAARGADRRLLRDPRRWHRRGAGNRCGSGPCTDRRRPLPGPRSRGSGPGRRLSVPGPDRGRAEGAHLFEAGGADGGCVGLLELLRLGSGVSTALG